MTNKQLAPKVRAWLKGSDVEPEDVRRSVGIVSGMAEHTRQRGRWWPLPSFRRRTEPRGARTEYQPSLVQAMDGQDPTAIGRTQTMLSPAKAITATAIIFGLGGVMLIAQPLGQRGSPSPGAATDGAIDACATPIEYVTGHIIWGSEQPGTERLTSRVGSHLRGAVYVNTMDLDDDRLDGPGTATLDWDISHSPNGNDAIRRGSIHVENEAGAWEGSFTGIGQWQALRNALSLTGSGAYDGLSAMLLHVSNDDIGGVIEGAIYATDIASCDFSAN